MTSEFPPMRVKSKKLLDQKERTCDQNDMRTELDDSDVINENVPRAKIRDHENVSNGVNSKTEDFTVKYRGKSYEISDLLKKHPGGRGTLRAFRGLALDKVFDEVPHSDAALHFFDEFLVDNQKEYDDIENLVNWKEPLLGQVGNLADRYWEWVNLPVNRSVRLFKSDFLENLTITPWYIIPIVWLPISIYFMFLGFVTNNFRDIQSFLPMTLFALSLGFFIWTIIEYGLHRNLFHLKPSPKWKILITLHFLLHGLHHKAPFDDQRLLFPPVAAIPLAMILYNLYMAVLPNAIVDFAAAGTAIGYLCYDLIHYYLHHGSPRAESYLYIMKRHHNHHHFSHHEQGFGISNRLWDLVFGTLIPLRQLKKAIIW